MSESHTASDRIIHYGREGELLIIACAAASWSDAAWKGLLDGSLEMERRLGSPTRLVLTYFPNGAPNAAQRRMSAETTKQSRLADRVALLSDSAVTRSAFTAIQWVLGQQTSNKAFRPHEVRPALDWLAEGAPFDLAAAAVLTKALIRAAHAAVNLPAVG